MARPRTQRIGLALFLFAPVFLVAGLMWFFALSLGQAPLMDVPPVGAGAGATSGANAIGELLSGNKANKSVKQPENKGAAPGAPAPQKTEPGKLIRAEDWEGGILFIVEDKSKQASASKPIYFGSTVNQWNPGDPKFKLEPQSDGLWRLQIPKPDRGVDFKFTLGSWEEVEQQADGKDIDNRMLPQIDPSTLKPGEPFKLEVVVQKFKVPKVVALEPYRTVAATGTVRRLQIRGGGGSAESLNRDALVWLPPGYDAAENARKAYPVLYMFDGQNLFEKPDSAPAEWGIDEVATDLIKNNKIEPIIIVGIQNAGALRTEEYVPSYTTEPLINNQPPAGAETLAWIMNTVRPRVERAFRVKPGSENTGIGGSSLGGLMSLYAGSVHPDVFGKVLAESPALGFERRDFWKPLLEPVKTWPGRMFMAVGGKEAGEGKDPESKDFADRVQGFNKHLAGLGLGKDRLKFVFESDAVHNEKAWNKRLPAALEFLFPVK